MNIKMVEEKADRVHNFHFYLQVKVTVKRVRKEFGTPIEFTDRNVGDAKDAYIECTSYEDKTFDLNKIELDKGTQAIPEFEDTSCQTDWRYPRNASTQYYPREFNEAEKEEHINSNTLRDFVENAVPRSDQTFMPIRAIASAAVHISMYFIVTPNCFFLQCFFGKNFG